jgi:hypothetical protein
MENYDAVLNIYWDPNENMFYDPCGIRIRNIFALVTPNDIFLFRQNPGYCSFPCRNDRRILCEISIEE